MSIDKDKIKHVSKLARISVNDKKIDGLTKDLTSIFKFIEQLNELNTDKVEPLSSIFFSSTEILASLLTCLILSLSIDICELC